jgi:hypothetical protein
MAIAAASAPVAKAAIRFIILFLLVSHTFWRAR